MIYPFACSEDCSGGLDSRPIPVNVQEVATVSFVTQVNRLLRASTRDALLTGSDPLQSLAKLQEELDLFATLADADPARSFVRQRLLRVVRIVNGRVLSM